MSSICYPADLQSLKDAISAFEPLCDQEIADRQMMLQAIDRQPTPLLRDNLFAHYTASSWIVSPDRRRVLMAWHNIYKTWAWTGGHADGESNLLNVAIREAREETGVIDIHPVFNEIYSLEVLPVMSHIKRGQFVSCHLHLNVTYLLEADDGQHIRAKQDENSAVAWLPLAKAQDNRDEPFMAVIYKKLNMRIPGCSDIASK